MMDADQSVGADSPTKAQSPAEQMTAANQSSDYLRTLYEYEALIRREQSGNQSLNAIEQLWVTAQQKRFGWPRATRDNACYGPTQQSRIRVDLKRLTISLDGKEFNVPSEQACRWIKVLASRPGIWISSAGLRDHDKELDGVRTYKLRLHVPPEINALVESRTGIGSRLMSPAQLWSNRTAESASEEILASEMSLIIHSRRR